MGFQGKATRSASLLWQPFAVHDRPAPTDDPTAVEHFQKKTAPCMDTKARFADLYFELLVEEGAQLARPRRVLELAQCLLIDLNIL